jgi:hypothetical protein
VKKLENIFFFFFTVFYFLHLFQLSTIFIFFFSLCFSVKKAFQKTKVLFSTSRIPLVVGASCVTFSATRGEPTPSTLTLVAEKSLDRLPLPLREIRA